MRRIISLLAIMALMAAMLVVMAAPAFAGQKVQVDPYDKKPSPIEPSGLTVAAGVVSGDEDLETSARSRSKVEDISE